MLLSQTLLPATILRLSLDRNVQWGEYVVTDNPQNVILPEDWHPVPDVVTTPLKNITLGQGLFRKVMENNVHYLMNSFTLD